MTRPCAQRDKAEKATFDLGIVCLWFPHQQGCCFAIEWVCGVGVQEQLRKECLEDIEQICRKKSLLVICTPGDLKDINASY